MGDNLQEINIDELLQDNDLQSNKLNLEDILGECQEDGNTLSKQNNTSQILQLQKKQSNENNNSSNQNSLTNSRKISQEYIKSPCLSRNSKNSDGNQSVISQNEFFNAQEKDRIEDLLKDIEQTEGGNLNQNALNTSVDFDIHKQQDIDLLYEEILKDQNSKTTQENNKNNLNLSKNIENFLNINETSNNKQQQQQKYQNLIDPLDLIEEEEYEPLRISEDNLKELKIKFPTILDIQQANDSNTGNTTQYNNLQKPWEIGKDNRMINYYKQTDQGTLNNFKFKCIATLRKQVIALGTASSQILIISNNGHIILQPNAPNGESFGQVCSIDFNETGEYLLAGYSKGQVVLYDLKKRSVFKVYNDIHAQPVIAVQFIRNGNFNKFITSDSDGYVFLVILEKGFFNYNREKQEILNKTAGPVYQIIQKSVKIGEKETSFIGLCSLQFILIIRLGQSVQMIYQTHKNEHTESQGKMPYISFNPQSQQDNLQIALVWGDLIKVVEFTDMKFVDNTDFQYGTLIKSEFINDKDLLSLTWISETIICFLDVHHQVNLIEIQNFTKIQPDQDNNTNEQTYIVSEQQELGSDITFHMYVQEQNEVIRTCFSQSIVQYENCIYMLGSNQHIYVVQFMPWDIKLNKLSDKKEWSTALTLGLYMHGIQNQSQQNINNKQILKYYGLLENPQKRQQQLKNFLENLIEKYISEIGEILTENSQNMQMWQIKILTSIEFSVYLNSFQSLFSNLTILFNKFKVYNLFLECLEPFILRNQIKYVTIDEFRDIINFYKKKQKLNVVKQMVINLDTSMIDSALVMTICLEFKLYSPLIYISTRVQQDFISPIVKMFSEYKRQIENQESEHNLSLHDQIQPVSNESLEKSTSKLGLKCLWYIRMCLKGILFPDQEIEKILYQQAIKHLFIWIFAKENLKILLNIDPYAAFNVIYQFFEGWPCVILKQSEVELKQSISISNRFEQDQKQQREIDLLSGDNDIQQGQPIFLQIIEILEDCSDFDNLEIKACFMHLVTEAVGKGFQLSYKLGFETIEYMLQFPEVNMFKYYSKDFIEDQSENKEIIIQKQQQSIYMRKEDNLLKILTQWNEVLKKDQNKLQNLIKISQHFYRVNSYLYYLNCQYKESLDSFLRSPNYEVQKQIYGYIFELFDELSLKEKNQQNEKIFNNLQQYLIKNVTSFVKIDPEQLRKLLEKFSSKAKNQAIKNLHDYPELQLKFIDNIVQDRRNKNQNVDEFLGIYIKLLCQLDPEKAIYELKTFQYPLEQAMEAVKQFNVKQGLAFLYQRSGAIQESINLYFELFQEFVEKNIVPSKKEIRNFENMEKLTIQIKQQIYTCVNVCIENHRPEDEQIEDYWFTILDNLLIYSENIGKQAKKQQYHSFNFENLHFYQNLISQIYSEIFEKMVQYINLSRIIEHLELTLDKYSNKEMRNTIIKLLQNYSYEASILSQADQIICDDLILLNTEQYLLNRKGIIFGDKCCQCQVHLKHYNADQEYFSQFECGHVFHKECHQNSHFCQLCNCETQEQLIQQLVLNPKNFKKIQQQINSIDKKFQQKKQNIEILKQKEEQKKQYAKNLSKFEKKDKRMRTLKIYDYKKNGSLMSGQFLMHGF